MSDTDKFIEKFLEKYGLKGVMFILIVAFALMLIYSFAYGLAVYLFWNYVIGSITVVQSLTLWQAFWIGFGIETVFTIFGKKA